jgi:hypothetical protein
MIRAINPYYTALIFVYWLAIFVWMFFHNRHGEQTTATQNLFMALPTLKFIFLSVYLCYSIQCPWDSLVRARYSLMLLVTICTIFKTIMVFLLLSIAKGEFVANQQNFWAESTQALILLSGIYLCYSAFYISGIRNVVLVCLDLLYVWLLILQLYFGCKTKSQVDA